MRTLKNIFFDTEIIKSLDKIDLICHNKKRYQSQLQQIKVD